MISATEMPDISYRDLAIETTNLASAGFSQPPPRGKKHWPFLKLKSGYSQWFEMALTSVTMLIASRMALPPGASMPPRTTAEYPEYPVQWWGKGRCPRNADCASNSILRCLIFARFDALIALKKSFICNMSFMPPKVMRCRKSCLCSGNSRSAFVQIGCIISVNINVFAPYKISVAFALTCL